MSTAANTPKHERTSPEIEQLKRKLDEVKIREDVFRARHPDELVAVTSRQSPDRGGVSVVNAFTKKGYTYLLVTAGPEWIQSSIPPVPGTGARKFYDERARIERKIADLQAGREVVPDEVADLIDPANPDPED